MSVAYRKIPDPPSFKEYVRKVVTENPNSEKTIRHLASMAGDYVDHYDQAVVIGTSSQSYIQSQKVKLFDEMRAASTGHCSTGGDVIDLNECIDDLIRSGDLSHNFDMRLFPEDR